MVLKFTGGGDAAVRQHYQEQFEKLGIEPDRIDIYGWMSLKEHFELYNEVDIGLDTYPYHGTTTTFEALWMGVPVVTLAGRHHASLVGRSILHRVGLDYFAAKSPGQFVAKATGLASNPDALAKIRSTMRQRMSAGGLCDGRGYTKRLEQAYRQIWNNYCDNRTDSE